MQVRVLYFGVLKELLHKEQEPFEVAEGASVADLIEIITGRNEVRADLWRSVAVAVNREYASTARLLQNEDEVALLPPVSGGSGKSGVHAG